MSRGVLVEARASVRSQRALRWIESLAALPERLAGTPSEREAAARVGQWMRELGVADVETRPVASRPRSGWVLALHAVVSLAGLWLDGFSGAVLAGLAALSFGAAVSGGTRTLSRALPAPASLSVVGRVSPDHPSRRIVLSAHIDAAQAGRLFSKPVAEFFARRAARRQKQGAAPRGPLALPQAMLFTSAGLALAGALGASGALLTTAQFVIGAALLLTTALGLEWSFAKASPGANDNASAVAAMLTCAEQLLAQLPADTELWMVGTGAEEVGCCGMHAFVDAHESWPRETTLFLNFECVGGGRLHWIRSEGTLDKSGYPSTGIELARRIAASGGFGDVTPADLLAGTDGHVPAAHGFPVVSLISLEENGIPRNYHRSDDVPAAIDASMVVRAGDFGAAIGAAWLRGEAGPLALL